MGLIDITRTDLFPQNQRETLRPAIMSVQNQGGGDFGAFGGFGNIGGVMGFPGSNDPTGGRGFVGPAVPPGTYRSPRGAEYMAEGGIASLMK